MVEFLLGNEAVALGAIDAGIRGAFSYPGTPATEIMEFVRQHDEHDGSIVARWSANEKVAYEEAMGMSFVGQRSLVSMKHVGLNVAADPFMSSALTGALGALVLAVSDDPGMHSSQNEQDTRFYADFARLPMFEPSNQQECYEMTREAFELSERFGLPVVIRLVMRISHSRGIVQRGPSNPSRRGDLGRGNPCDWTLLPPNARRRSLRLHELQSELLDYSHRSRFNKLRLQGPRGVIACGVSHNYVCEALGQHFTHSLLKLCTYPVPINLIWRLVDHCEEILVVEEGYPLVESKLTGLLGLPGKAIHGRCDGALPPDGELTVDLLRKALGLCASPSGMLPEAVAPRPPCLCQGCPHCDTFKVITDAAGTGGEPYYFSDIGCYTLGAYPPHNAIHACVDMGASIGMALGASRAGAHPVIATIGDSTFTHSGMAPLLQAAHENANMTVVIMDNSGIAMTGGQDIFITGDAFIPLLRGLGVDARHIGLIDPIQKEHGRNVELLRKEIAYHGLSVVLACRPCIHLKRRAAQTPTTHDSAVTSTL